MTKPNDSDRAAPLRDEGLVEFAIDEPDAYPRLHDAIRDASGTENRDPPLGSASVRYRDYRELLRLLHKLQMGLLREEAERIRVRMRYEDGAEPWRPLAGMFESVSGRGVPEYILHRYFTTHMQPIVQPSGRIVGYECLLRPLPEQAPFRPAELFEKARHIGLHSFLDREARHLAIRLSSSHLPQGMKRFVNFLPSSLYCADTCLQGTFEAIRETGTDPGDVVFEVVETEPLHHPGLADVFDRYRREGIRMAVDDVGSGYATVDSIERLQPDYVKMDRRWVSFCDQDAAKQRHIAELLERASRFHGVVLAEGVEREQEWAYLRKAGVPLFQGYLFGKASPVPATELRTLSGK